MNHEHTHASAAGRSSTHAGHGSPQPNSVHATDPVCGMTVDPNNARGGSFEHQGTKYFFCNPRCREKFSVDPERYSRKRSELQPEVHAANAPSTGDDDALYVCPMDPEVRSSKPGICPKCGMALERQNVTSSEEANPELIDMSRRFWVSAALTAPTFVLAMSDLIPGNPVASWLSPKIAIWIQLLLASPVVLWGGAPFFHRGWVSIRNRSPNMFTLIALGTFAAFGFSVFATFFPELLPHTTTHAGMLPVYYEASAVIITLVLLGQVLELRARGATSGAIRALLRLNPKTARRIEDDGSEVEVGLDQVQVGDRLRVKPSDKIPVDGVVIDGSSAVDESSISGESMPSEKTVGSRVTGGTLNGSGSFAMRADRVGKDTLLAQIVALVGEAQRSRAPIQRLADVVSSYFVPAVIAVALLTAGIWGVFGPEPRLAHALTNAVAVLIIACPCALGLATPMSIMVGTGRGAQAGILVKNAEALELLERVNTLLVDKTGTLTEGKPTLVDVVVAPGFDESQVLSAAAALETSSEHPLATAIVNGSKERRAPSAVATDFRAVVGKGVVAKIEGVEVALGNAKLLSERGLDSSALDKHIAQMREHGQTVVFLAIGGKLAGALGITDPIKKSTPAALYALREQGIKIVMLTGDSAATANAVAKQLGIEDVRAEVLPQQKNEVVSELRRQGRVVAMAGDGTNDAPALAAAHVGIAMGTGTDVAIQSASVTLIKGDLNGIVRARRLSREVMKNIRQNLFFAFVYNTVGVPLAAGILYPFLGILLSPMLASAAMALSSVSVIGNALRLRAAPLDSVPTAPLR